MKDAEDIALVILRVFDVLENDIFDHHWDLLDQYETTDLYAYLVGSRALGRMTAKISQPSPDLHQRLLTIMQGHIEQGPEGPLPQRLHQAAIHPPLEKAEAIQLLKAFHQGLSE